MGAKNESRVLEIADYIISTGATLRDAAKVFHISKSTIHLEITEYLKATDRARWEKVREVFDYHLRVRHLRGGEATRLRYQV